MNRHQVKGHANEAEGKISKEAADKATDDKSPKSDGKAQKHGDNDGAVLGDINREPAKHRGKDRAVSGNDRDDADKRKGKGGAVLGKINDDASD